MDKLNTTITTNIGIIVIALTAAVGYLFYSKMPKKK